VLERLSHRSEIIQNVKAEEPGFEPSLFGSRL
jgi:hypothetical protein